MQQAKKMGETSENIKEGNGQFMETSDLADLVKASTSEINQLLMWQIMELQFQARDEEIREELSDSNLEPEQRRKLNQQKACLANQQRLLETFRTREINIKKKYENGDPDDKMSDEIQVMYQQYASESANACPES
ncbi:hypothetical protein QT970_28715 [Microcoleus sp. herbarium8]